MARRPFFKAASSLAAILILAAGCADTTPTGIQIEEPTFAAANAPKGPRANVVTTVFAAGSHAAVVGPQGGTIDFGIGSIHFPAGAVSRATRITATTDGTNLGVTFAPHGLTFPAGSEPTLTFHSVEEQGAVSIVYIDAEQLVLETVATKRDIAAGSVHGRLAHFSTYAIAKD